MNCADEEAEICMLLPIVPKDTRNANQLAKDTYDE